MDRRFTHQRSMSDISETHKPLLLSPPRSIGRLPSLSPEPTTYEFAGRPGTPGSYAQMPSIALNSVPLFNDKTSHETLADLARMPLPSLSPPTSTNKPLPVTPVATPKLPERPASSVSKPMNTTTDLLHRPSFLTKPRPAPSAPGTSRQPSRRGRPDMRGALLTRMATKRARSTGDPADDSDGGSPVSIYSQASLKRGDTYKFFPKRKLQIDPSAPPVPSLPRHGERDALVKNDVAPAGFTRSNSFSGMPSPSRHAFGTSPIDDDNASLPTPNFLLNHPFFNDDTALPSPEFPLISSGKWWPNAMGSHNPSSPTYPSSSHGRSGGLDIPYGQRSSSDRATTKNLPWFHAMPEFAYVDDQARVDAESGQVMVAAWNLGNGEEKAERQARKLPAPPTAPS